MLNIAVIDDEKLFQKRIGKFLQQFLKKNRAEYEVEYFASGKEIVEMGVGLSRFEIFFLDINMEEIDGIKVAEEIRKYSDQAFIVFVTAYISYSLEGYKVNAIRYVLKDNEHLEESLSECM